MVLATPGHLPGFCRSELQFLPFHGEHCSQLTISTPNRGSCTTSFYSCYLYSETTKTRRTKEQIFLRVEKEQSAYPTSRYYQRIIRTRSGVTRSIVGNHHQACVVPKPRLFAQKNAAIKPQKHLFPLEECGVVLGQRKNEREHKEGREKRSKEKGGKKGDEWQGWPWGCCSFRLQLQAQECCKEGRRAQLPPLLGLCGSAVRTMGMGSVINKIRLCNSVPQQDIWKITLGY